MSVREQKKAETSGRLIKAARARFFEDGYAAASMDQICADAGVTRGALYHNFGGKEGLFEAVVRQIDQEIGDELLVVAGDETSPGAFITTCVAYLELATDPEIQRIMFRDGPAVLGQRFRDIDREGSIEPLRQALVDLQNGGLVTDADPEALAVLINGAMIEGALWVAQSEQGRDTLPRATDALKAVLRGIIAFDG